MSEDPFEEELRPARAADLLGPRGQRLAAHAAEHRPLREWPVDDHRGAAVGRSGGKAPIGLGLGKRVVHLDEIDVSGLDDLSRSACAPA